MLEPWLRGTLTELDAVRRQVLHVLELAGEDAERWCATLTDEEMCTRPGGLASVCFHLRHLVRSLDRLLTYAEGRALMPKQLELLAGELDCEANTTEVMREFRAGLERAAIRVRAFDPGSYEEARGVGRQRLPTTVGGLLVHCAEHSQRHIGQAVTTAQIVGGPKSRRNEARGSGSGLRRNNNSNPPTLLVARSLGCGAWLGFPTEEEQGDGGEDGQGKGEAQ